MDEGHIDPDAAQRREVFAYFGLAMYYVQCLEKQLALLLAIEIRLSQTEMSETQFDKTLEDLWSRPFGPLVKSFGRLKEPREDEKDRLRKARDKRNWLVHHYFSDRSFEILSGPGRASMIEELSEAACLFQTLDQQLTNLTMELGDILGITQQSIDQELERLLRDREDIYERAIGLEGR